MISLLRSSFAGGEIAPSLYARTDLEKYSSSCAKVRNFFVTPYGEARNRPGLKFIWPTKYSGASKSILVPFQFSVTQWYFIEFGVGYARFYKDDGIILSSGSPYEISTPYAEADLESLQFEQTADVMYITHPTYATRKLTRSGHTAWTLTTPTFGPTLAAPASFTRSSGGGTGHTYCVTAVNQYNQYDESLTSGTAAGGNGDTFTWTAVSGAAYYNFYEMKNGVARWLGDTSTTSFTVDSAGMTPDYSKSSPTAATLSFTSSGSYPGSVAFHLQNLFYARTNDKPQTLFKSVTGSFDNFTKGIPIQDTDATSWTLNSTRVNEIRSLLSVGKTLFVGTSGAEWTMEPGESAGNITPSSYYLKQQSRYGCGTLRPILVGSSVLVLDGSHKVVRAFSYSLESDSYTPEDLSLLASHLLEGYTITSWAYEPYPNSTIWATRSDGKLLGLTYHKEHKVFAWHLHDTEGLIERVASITKLDGTCETWVIVKRSVGGSDVRYVEKFASRDVSGGLETGVFLDSSLSYSGTAVTSVSGLSHLEGKTVSALADGRVVEDLTVTSGAVTLPWAASTVHVGLPYTCVLETLDFVFQGQDGTSQDKQAQIESVLVAVRDTAGFDIGPNADRLVTWKPDEYASGSGVDSTETGYYTGDVELAIHVGDARLPRVYVEVNKPIPCIIQSIAVRITTGQT